MEQKKPRANPFQALIDAYEQELSAIDITVCPNVVSQIRMEIRRLRDGVIDSVDLLSSRKVKVRAKIDFPVEQYPTVNFPGKVIGPQAKTLKELQEKTGTRMSVLGSGSMRNHNKELELIKSGDPKYHHLNERLHLQVDCLSTPSDAYSKISTAMEEIKAIITPDPEEVPNSSMPLSWTDISMNQHNRQTGSNSFNSDREIKLVQNNRSFNDYQDQPNVQVQFGGQYGDAPFIPKMNQPQQGPRFKNNNPYSRLGNFSNYP